MNQKTILLAGAALVGYMLWQRSQAAPGAAAPSMSAAMQLGITAAALYAAYHYGSPVVKGLAIGAAGTVVANQLPIVRDGLNVRLAA